MELTESDNWYAYLRLSPGATLDKIQSAVERLSRQASALAATAPERSQSLRETIRSIKRDLLSGPENRQRYDAPRLQQRAAPATPVPAAGPPAPASPQPAPNPLAPNPLAPNPLALSPQAPAPAPYPPAGQGAGARIARFLRTGWTCPACGKGGVPSDKFCTRCGTPIQPVRPEAAPESERVSRPRLVCGDCANPLGPMDAFCAKCGARR